MASKADYYELLGVGRDVRRQRVVAAHRYREIVP